MNHLVIPLDTDHVQAVRDLVEVVADAAGLSRPTRRWNPHVTLISHDRLPRAGVPAAIEGVLATTEPFLIHAHGYSFFTGSEPSDLSLHVPVVRGRPLDLLHRRLCAALRQAGAEIAGWSEPELWSPHITLFDRELDPASLGKAAAWLAGRQHRSWRIPVDRVAVSSGLRDRGGPSAVLPFGPTPTSLEGNEGSTQA